jgi:hypothetical protein
LIRRGADCGGLFQRIMAEHSPKRLLSHVIAEFKTTVAQQQKQIEALTATVQKVSNQVTLSKPLPKLVANP